MFTMLAASKMNGGRDRLHELSGIPPLSFTSKGKPLTAWSITGNTVQNGTPTPENPVEVQGVGDYDSETGMYKIPVNSNSIGCYQLFIPTNFTSNGITQTIDEYGIITLNGVVTVDYFNLPNNLYGFRNTSSPVFVRFSVLKNNDSIPLQYGWLNRSKATDMISGVGSTSTIFKNANTSSAGYVGLKNFAIGTVFNDVKVRIEEFNLTVMFGRGNEPKTVEECKNIFTDDYYAPNTPITTPIYLPTPLYSGEVMRSDGSREVKWGKLVLTGEETWRIEQHKNFYIDQVITNALKSCTVFCTHQKSSTNGISFDNENCFISTSGRFNFQTTIIEHTVEAFKSWLADQYAAGTPVTVWYKLAAPTTETFTAPQIPTLNGTTIIDVDTAVKPESMTIKYRS